MIMSFALSVRINLSTKLKRRKTIEPSIAQHSDEFYIFVLVQIGIGIHAKMNYHSIVTEHCISSSFKCCYAQLECFQLTKPFHYQYFAVMWMNSKVRDDSEAPMAMKSFDTVIQCECIYNSFFGSCHLINVKMLFLIPRNHKHSYEPRNTFTKIFLIKF